MRTLKLFGILIPSICLSILSGCSVARSNYVPVSKIETTKKDSDAVEYFVFKPKRVALALGLLTVNGNGYSQHNDLLREAKNEAAKLGADFILLENSGTETTTTVNPGYTTYQASSPAQPIFLGNSGCVVGSPGYQASGYSVGPSISTFNFPWAVFSLWVYKPSSSGLDADDDGKIKGFHLNCDAESIGMKIGDKIIGIDGIDMKDERIVQHVMQIQPGDQMVYSILRDSKRMDFTIIAMPN